MTDKQIRHLKKKLDKELELRSRSKSFVKKLNRPTEKRNYTLYVLICEGGRRYAGITCQRVSSRFEQHQSGKGSLWTKKYPPIGIDFTIPLGYMLESEATIYERDATHKLIQQYGLENVRGGDLCNVKVEVTDKHLKKSVEHLEKVKNRADLHRQEVQENIAAEVLQKLAA